MAVFLRGQLVVCVQVTLQHREVFAAFKANDVIVPDRSLDIYGRLRMRRLRRGPSSVGESAVDIVDQFWKVGRVDPVVCHVRCNDLRSQAQSGMSCLAFLTAC